MCIKKSINLFLISSIALSHFFAINAVAEVKPKSASANSNRLGLKLGTDHHFDELSVKGKYQSSFEGIATVENEKQLDDLLDYRTNYRDRLKRSREQR